MSQPRSRSPLYSRSSTLLGREEDGFYGEHYHSSVHSDPWRNPEKVHKLDGNSHWVNGPSKGEEEVDHWAKFIEAIGHTGGRQTSPMSRYHTQDDIQRFEDRSSHSPRRLPRERLSSPEALRYNTEARQRIPSPGRSRKEHDAVYSVKHYPKRTPWDSRSSSPRRSEGKRRDGMEHGYDNEEHDDRYHERSSFSERSVKSNYREHHPHPKRIRGLDPQEDVSISHRGFSSHNAPVIVEHDHGIPNSDPKGRDPPKRHDTLRNQAHPRSRDPLRVGDLPRSRDPLRGNDLLKGREQLRARDSYGTREPSRGREPLKRRRDADFQAGIPQGEKQGGSASYVFREGTRFLHSSVERSPMRSRSQHQELSRVEPQARERHGPHREQTRMEPQARERHGPHQEQTRMEPHAREQHGPHREQTRMEPHAREQHGQHREESRMEPHARERHGPHREQTRTEPHVRERYGPHQEQTRMEPHVRERYGQHREQTRTEPHAREEHGQHREQTRTEPHAREQHGQHREQTRTEPHAREQHGQHREQTRMEPHAREEHGPHREQTRMEPHAREQHGQQREHSRMEPHARERCEQRSMDRSSDVDLRNNKSNKARASGHAWEEAKPRSHGGLEPGKGLKEIPHHRNQNTSAARMDFTKHETLRIKVDMSRPVGQSSHIGYSSERQLSLDLVNVGRQRLDFLPMLEHSGNYKESAMHSGTFAQEIITLVHHVNEIYFQGQDITLNERFSSEQHYSFVDEDEFAEEEFEVDEMNPVINRPLGGLLSDTQIFCKLGSWQPQRRQVPAPGDLRHDLERRRQQRLEGVKITIAGGCFSQMAPQSQGNEPAYTDEVRELERDDFGWSEENKEWEGPRQKMPAPNFDARPDDDPNFNRIGKRRGLHVKRNPNNDASW